MKAELLLRCKGLVLLFSANGFLHYCSYLSLFLVPLSDPFHRYELLSLKTGSNLPVPLSTHKSLIIYWEQAEARYIMNLFWLMRGQLGWGFPIMLCMSAADLLVSWLLFWEPVQQSCWVDVCSQWELDLHWLACRYRALKAIHRVLKMLCAIAPLI